jgi:hypothetical protein
MIDRTTRFACMASKLKPPTSAAFVLQEWIDAFEAGSTTKDDAQLFEAAQWIGIEAEAAKDAFPNPTLSSLNAEWNTILAVATLNREYRTAIDLHKDAATAAIEAGTLSLDAIAALRIRNNAGQEVRVPEIAETGTDLTENWLYDAAAATGTAGIETADLAQAAVQAARFYSFRKVWNVLWNQVWHEGWYVQVQGVDGYRWVPHDRERERLEFAWRCRQDANLMNQAHILQALWHKLTPAERRKNARKLSVTEITKDRGNLKFKVGSVPYLSKKMPRYAWEKAMLEGSYVADFIDSPFPADSDLSAALLLRAWHVVVDVAHLITKPLPPLTLWSPADVRTLALPVQRVSLTHALKEALKIEKRVADSIIQFLTFKFQTGGTKKAKGNKGLWAAPLVPVPGSTDLLLPLPVLLTSNLARRAEAWLEKGGINDDNAANARGDRYERLFRNKICNAVSRNKLFTTARSATSGIDKGSEFNEQIDLLVTFGGLCLVGEVKFFLMPADPHERTRFNSKIGEAAKQAKRKALALQERPDVIARALGINTDEASALRLLPIVVTNQDYGFSTRVEEVLVVHAEFLRLYLGSGKILSGMAFAPGSGQFIPQTTTFYRSEKAAAEIFEGEVSSPYVLNRFLRRIDWITMQMPTLAHSDTHMDTLELQDVTGSERNLAEILIAGLPPRT